MNELMKFEGNKVEIMQDEKGSLLFEIYSTGMALGYARSNGKSTGEHRVHPESKTIFPYKSRIDKIVANAEITLVSHGAKKFLTESQLYDFMIEARTEKCRTFRKWVTNEVLPSIRKTGSYSMPQKGKQLELYEYFDKSYNGEPVLSVADVSYITGLNRATVNWFIRAKLTIDFDYYLLSKSALAKFKDENPKVSRIISCMYVITKSGFDAICKAYGIKLETPKLFIEEKKEETSQAYPLQFTTPQLKEKMADLRKAAERLIHLTYLLDNEPGTIICGQTYHEFSAAIIRQAKKISFLKL